MPFLSILTLISLSLSLTACFTPRSVVRLKPQDKDTRWYHGQEYAHDEQGLIGVAVSFVEMQGEYLVMDVEVNNFSPITVLVDPAKFFYQDENNGTNSTNYPTFAYNPEQVILEIDKKQSRLDARRKNTQLWLGITAAAITTAAIVSEVKRDKRNSSSVEGNNSVSFNVSPSNTLDNTLDALSILAAFSSENNYNYQFNAEGLDMMKQSWERGTLRKTHLFPEETIQGTVLFKAAALHKGGPSLLGFYFPIEGSPHKIVFQKLIFPAGATPTLDEIEQLSDPGY